MSDYAIHDTTLEAIADTIRKKDGTQALIDPANYADRINLMGMLEEKTASGAIASFDDGADDVPIYENIANIDYNGSLQESFNLYKFGKNLLNDTSPVVAINEFKFIGDEQSGVSLKYLPAGTYTFKYYARQGVTANAITIMARSTALVQDWTSPTKATFTINEPKDNILITLVRFNGWADGDIIGAQLELGDTPTEYESFKGEKIAVQLGHQIYGGFFNSRTAVLTSTKAADGSDLSEPVEYQTINYFGYNTLAGFNNIFCDRGNTEITYRSSGTITPVPIQPVLVSKTITENGVYSAEDDDADGYDEVTVTVQSATCERLMHARCVNNDQEEIPAISNIDQGANYSTYLSYDSTTKKFTVLQDFTGVVIAWVYAYRAYDINRPDGAFYLNNTLMLSYETTGNSAGSTGGRSGIYNFKQGDTFWMYTPTRHGYPQQNCKVYLVTDLDDDIFTFADEEETA